MAQTLFERLTYGKPKPEDSVYNPLEAKVGSRFQINTIEHRNSLPYILKGLREYTRNVNGKERKFTDYLFETFRLRIIPADRTLRQPLQFSCYLINEDGREEWMPELYNDLRSSSGEFNIHKDGKTDKYFRFKAEGERKPGSPHYATVRELFDENSDGKIHESEIASVELEYFDYFRPLEDAANQKYDEYLFIEHNTADRTFLFLIGKEVIAENIICL